ncbi:MAG: hypothetical protein R3190_06180, partial [Thermoanaerobaculia bacterium]|nr:hypothetical protein [Thermoanaerobaculia bacterium]
MPAEADLEAALDALYRAAPAAFVAERDRLVREARRDDRALAERLRALRKPTQACWALNRLHLDGDATLPAVIAAGEDLRRAVAAGADAPAQQLARRARSEAIEAACQRALAAIEEGGETVATATPGRLRRSLEAVAAYGAELPAPGLGRLESDLEPPGFELL